MTTIRPSLKAVLAASVVGFLLFCSASAAAQTGSTSFTSYSRYDDVNRKVGEISASPDGTGQGPFIARRYSYDQFGRLALIETGVLATYQVDGVPPNNWQGFTITGRVEIGYDTSGRKVLEVTKGSDGVAAAATQYSYDSYDRLICTAARMNPAAYGSLPADACALGSSGSNGPDRITRNSYTTNDDLWQVQKAYGVTTANGFPQTLEQTYLTYTLDASGRPLTVTDANSNKAGYTYDGYGRLAQWNFPDKTSVGAISSTDYEAYTYDANSNRASLRKRDGSVINYSYDALNRMTVKDIPGGTSNDVYYGYDLRGLQTWTRFGSASGAGLTNAYDGFGQLASTSTTQSGSTLTLGYQYDADGNRARVTYPDGTYFTFSYDGLDRQTATLENGSASVATIAYDNQGRRSGDSRGAVSTAYTYDAISRPTGISDDLAGTAYDVSSTFAYNPASQIISKVRSNDSYAFPGYVNVSRSYAVNGLNQYTTGGPATYSYDANGNLTGDGISTYTYDVENRLTGRSGGLTLTYDPDGRLWQTSGTSTGTIRFLYDGDQLAAEYDGANNLLRRYVHGPGDDDPILWYEGAGLGDRRSLQIDGQGSIVSVADAGGNKFAINSYDEYGIRPTGNQGRFQYTGQAWLPELGMYYYKARIYSPTLGRFMQTDPIGYKDQINLYAYVGNDPANGRDPTGLDTEVTLMGYPLGGAGPITWGHSYVVYRDTETGETRVLRGGPSSEVPDAQQSASRAASNSSFQGPDKQPITLTARDDRAGASPDYGKKGPEGFKIDSQVTKKDFSQVVSDAQKFTKSVNGAGETYRPRGPNSNSVAGSFFRSEAGRSPSNNSNVTFPGLSQQVPAVKVSPPNNCGPMHAGGC